MSYKSIAYYVGTLVDFIYYMYDSVDDSFSELMKTHQTQKNEEVLNDVPKINKNYRVMQEVWDEKETLLSQSTYF